MVGINVIGAWNLASHHRLLLYHQGSNCTLKSFAGIPSKQLLILAKKYDSHKLITIDNMVSQSVSDMSQSPESTVTTKKRKWKYQKWMNKEPEPVSIVYYANGGAHPLCQCSVTMRNRTRKI